MSTLYETDTLVHHVVRQHCVLSCLQMSSSVFYIERLFFLIVIDILLTPPRLSCCGLDSPRWEGLWENCTALIVAACGGVKMELYWWQAGVVIARSSVSWGREGNYCWSCCIFSIWQLCMWSYVELGVCWRCQKGHSRPVDTGLWV